MMTRPTTTAAALGLAFALASSAAWAATTTAPSATKTVPANKSDKPAGPAKKVGTAPAPAATAATAQRGRDWNQIDTNRDNLISPEEMETWLAANPGPQRSR